ncbi:MAG: trypsin-like serine protease [Actinomycetota bacterium]|nr:trypsin-like serine protease [Actinomycetota bacterium]
MFLTLQVLATAIAAIAPMFAFAPAPAPVATATSTQARSSQADPTVAALFDGSSQTSDHTCTASVVSSTAGDLLITAAHCVTGTGNGTGTTVAPGYNAGATPYGVWSVTGVFVDSAWKTSQPDSDDFAILRVAPKVVNGTTRELQDVTGANTLADTPSHTLGPTTLVTVQGFNTGINDHAISCTNRLQFTGGEPTFGCGGYVDGSSGSPWIVVGSDGLPRVTGVIGGLNQGGCTSQTSYSPSFGAAVHNLLARAEQPDARGDITPGAGPGPGC